MDGKHQPLCSSCSDVTNDELFVLRIVAIVICQWGDNIWIEGELKKQKSDRFVDFLSKHTS